MKFRIFLIFAFLLFFMFSTVKVDAMTQNVYVNSNGVEMTREQINNLYNLGFTQLNIDRMSQVEFDNNTNLVGNIESIDTKYVKTTYIYSNLDAAIVSNKVKTLLPLHQYNSETLKQIISKNSIKPIMTINEEITEEEFNNVNEAEKNIYVTNDTNPDIHETTYKKITTTISYISSNNQYRLKNDLLWKQIPSNRSNELYGIAINNSVAEPVSGSHFAKTYYSMKETCNNTTSSYETSHNSVSNWKRGATGYAVSFQLPSNRTDSVYWAIGQEYPCYWPEYSPFPPNSGGPINYDINVNSLSSTMYFNVAKNGSGPLSAYGSYQHSVTTISVSSALTLSISTTGELGGVFSGTLSIIEKFDGMAGTHAQILNPTW